MIRGIYTAAGLQIDGLRLLYCRTKPEVSMVSNRTLGGLWFTQTIGEPGIRAEVEVLATGVTARDEVLDFYANGAKMLVVFDDYERSGYILEVPDIEVVKPGAAETRVFKLTFQLGVTDEEETT